MKPKNQARLRRAIKARLVVNNSKSQRPRMVIFRSGLHIYSQIIVPSEKGDIVLAAASTVDKEIKSTLKGNKCEQAHQVGQLLAKRAMDKELSKVAFDRRGYKFHGRVKALATGAREAGLDF